VDPNGFTTTERKYKPKPLINSKVRRAVTNVKQTSQYLFAHRLVPFLKLYGTTHNEQYHGHLNRQFRQTNSIRPDVQGYLVEWHALIYNDAQRARATTRHPELASDAVFNAMFDITWNFSLAQVGSPRPLQYKQFKRGYTYADYVSDNS